MTWRMVFLVLALVGASSPAFAQAPSKDVQRQARASFDSGEKLFNQQSYEAALTEFQRAFELVAHDAVRFNIAVCLEKLGRFREAVEEYEAASKSSTLSQKDLARARAAAEVARRSLGHLSVKGTAGMAVKVDDATRCQTPCQLELDPRTYRVRVGAAAVVELAIQSGREHVLLANAEAPPAERLSAVPRVVPARPVDAEPKHDTAATRGPGVLTWTGGALALVGAGGTVFFGLRTQKLHDDYTNEPTQERLDDGNRSKLFTNVSIGVAAVGATLIVIDLLFLAPEENALRDPRRGERSARAFHPGFRF